MRYLLRKILYWIVPELTPMVSDPPSTEEEERWKLGHSDFTSIERRIIGQVFQHSMTGNERLCGLIRAVEYIVSNKIEGDFVECGVWKGGSGMAMALALNELGDHSRKIHLYDTYDGMSEPSAQDESIDGITAKAQLETSSKEDGQSVWCYSTLEQVQNNMRSTHYPEEKIIYIKGKVEETIPQHIPLKIALLRLDTDWYESTKHELVHLFPRLVKGGVLVIDDYGHWKGCRKAVDEYIEANDLALFLIRIDYTGRMAVKP